MFINKFNFPILCLSVWNAISSPNFRSAAIEGDLSREYQYSKNPLPMSEMRTFPLLHCYLHIEDKIHRHTQKCTYTNGISQTFYWILGQLWEIPLKCKDLELCRRPKEWQYPS